MNYDAYFLSVPLRSNGVRLLFSFYLFFYSPFKFRNYSTDFRNIFRNCIFWCSLNQGCNIKTGLNNPVVLKLFWHHLAEIAIAKKQLKFALKFKR